MDPMKNENRPAVRRMSWKDRLPSVLLKKRESFFTEKEYTSILEELLEEAGNNGKFQKYLNYGFLYPYTMVLPFAVMATMFMVAIPDHYCHVPGSEKSIMSHDQWRNVTIPREINPSGVEVYSKCSMYDLSDYWDNETEKYDIWELTEKPNKTVPCSHGWDYDTTWYSRTAPSQEDWVCSLDHVAATTLSMGEMGTVVGALIFGHLADRIGRKTVFLLTTLVRIVFRTMTILSAGIIPLFFAANFLAATSMPLIYQAPYTLCIEFSAPSQRAMVNTGICVAWVIGMCIMPLVVWVARDWVIIGAISIIPLVLFIGFYWILPESLRWLLSQGKTEEARKVLETIARVNGNELRPESLKAMEKLSRTGLQNKQTYGFLTFFQYKSLAITTIAMILTWTVNLVGYMVLQLNFGNMTGNPFVNSFLLALIELPAYLLAYYLVNNLGRRWTQVLFLFLEGLSALAIVAVVTDQSLAWLVTTLTLIAKFSVTASFYAVYLQAVEVFPTCLRNTGMSFASMVSSIFNIGSPYILYLGTYDARYPYLFLGIMSIIGSFFATFLPETLNQDLPETVEDAVGFAKHQSYFNILPPKPRRPSIIKPPLEQIPEVTTPDEKEPEDKSDTAL